MEENLNEIIQFTAIGSYKRKAVYDFTNFIGYKDIIEISPIESIPNPIDRITYVQNYIKELLVNEMAEMNIINAINEANETFQNSLNNM